jgi:signal transduction histidine kinase/phage shock protein PspC (stress-responsive transcriptional regulator)
VTIRWQARPREVAIDTTVHESPRLYRSRDARLAAGVAAGIAGHLGVPVVAVRVAFVVLLGFNGLGALLYAVFWAVLPVAPQTGAGTSPQERLIKLLPFAALALGVLVARAVVGGDQPATAALGWLFALIAVGVGIIWHQTGGAEAPRRADPSMEAPVGAPPWLGAMLTETGRRAYLLRFVGGGGLIAIGTVGLAAVYAPVGGGSIAAVVNGLLFALLALVGVALVTAPLLWRMFGALRQEREARIREQERAEFAAMVHDQVLHTLALIQRNAPAGSDAHRLARAQERTLRNWLYRPTGSPTGSFAAALEQAAAEVEDAYAITVEVVVVGADPDGDRERCEALVNAAREALVNAARHAQVSTVSLYAEVEAEQISVFVRDRGVGFDPDAVDPGRHGLRGSIIGRMRRHGGGAEIISAPGEGTEVRLQLPLTVDTKEGAA